MMPLDFADQTLSFLMKISQRIGVFLSGSMIFLLLPHTQTRQQRPRLMCICLHLKLNGAVSLSPCLTTLPPCSSDCTKGKVTRFLNWKSGTFSMRRWKILTYYHYEIKNGDKYFFIYFNQLSGRKVRKILWASDWQGPWKNIRTLVMLIKKHH